MNNFNQVRPIKTSPKPIYEIKKDLTNFFDLWEEGGQNLRSEYIANNKGCRVVIVFDWEEYEQSASK